MKLKIKVTKEILLKSSYCGFRKNGERRRGMSKHYVESNCAISLAIRDIFPKAWVGTDNINFRGGCKAYLPDEAQVFIDEFDDASIIERQNMVPIKFEIDVPEAVIKRVNIDEVKKILSTSTTMELV